jgi:ADP-ribosyl-[dinitrogen reductase] hydrolase
MHGVLLGTALGDALGLPFEGLSPERVARRLHGRELGHSLLFGRGVLSDDTEHACMVARALVESGGRVPVFQRSLARQLRWWFAALPPGVGLATARGCVRLWLGWSPARSGVMSAGNGPAMRAALLGLYAGDEVQLVRLVEASTMLTHRDPRALDGALLVARWARSGSKDHEPLLAAVAQVRDAVFAQRVCRAITAAAEGCSLDEFRTRVQLQAGPTGFVIDTLVAVAFCWLRYRERPADAIAAAVALGGDTDTVAAIVGALLGAELGARELGVRVPETWLTHLRDWPLSTEHLCGLAVALTSVNHPVPRLAWVASLARNLVVLLIVLGHGFARLARIRAPERSRWSEPRSPE